MSIAFDDLAYVCLYCADLDESVRFYRDVLGLHIQRHTPDFCQLALGATRLGLEPGGWRKGTQKSWTENPILLQFRAHSLDELEAMNRQLEAHGVNLLARSVATNYGVVTNFLDPDGNKLEVLYQDDAHIIRYCCNRVGTAI
jgi:catechol 2,3-dioxygenase-like lactoylglutathione lyase family enzyme